MTEPPPITFSRATGRLDDASTKERLAAFVMQAGAKASALVARRGFSIGCRVLSKALDQRDIVVLLGEDARGEFRLLVGAGDEPAIRPPLRARDRGIAR